jgi:hypothetical protein
MKIQFRDSLGWYCPGYPWCDPDEKLLAEWTDDIKTYNRKDVRIVSK